MLNGFSFSFMIDEDERRQAATLQKKCESSEFVLARVFVFVSRQKLLPTFQYIFIRRNT
jgi:hypothetical protein